MQEGNEFINFRAFKAAVQYWAVTGTHKFNFRYQKSHNVVDCAFENCIKATYSSTRQYVVVRVL